MSESDGSPRPVQAHTRRRRVPVIWIIPIVAIAIGGWLAWNTLSKEGPTITISFDTAEGLQAGQSQLKFKEITLGTVQSLDLTPDHSHVLVRIKTTRQAEPLLTDTTVFWVVKPRLFAGNVSGLDTLLSGSYVGMMPAETAGKPQREFTGREDPPVLQANVPGHIFLLKAARLGSISLGSPVFFRDLSVGEVLGWDIADMATSVTIRAFVRAPYDTYVHDESRFWNASGVSLKIGGAGVELQMESLRALLLGGIAFDTPAEQYGRRDQRRAARLSPVCQPRSSRRCFVQSQDSSDLSFFRFGARARARIRGYHAWTGGGPCNRRAPLVRRGTEQDRGARTVRGRTGTDSRRRSQVDLQDVSRSDGGGVETRNASVVGQRESDHGAAVGGFGFRAECATGAGDDGRYDFVLPTTSGGGFAGLQASATDLLNNVNAIPFKQIGDNLDGMLRSANGLVGDPQLHQALADLSGTLASAKTLIAHLDNGLGPAVRQLPEIATGLQKTLTSANKLVLSLDNGYGDNTQFNRDLSRLLAQLTDAVRSIRSLADLLARNPEALIKGRITGGTE